MPVRTRESWPSFLVAVSGLDLCDHAFVCDDFARPGVVETLCDCVDEPEAFGQRIKLGGGKEHAGRATVLSDHDGRPGLGQPLEEFRSNSSDELRWRVGRASWISGHGL